MANIRTFFLLLLVAVASGTVSAQEKPVVGLIPKAQKPIAMDGKLTGMTVRRYHDYIVGIKLAHFTGNDWKPTDEAVKAATIAGTPVMIDFGGSNPPLPIEELFSQHLRPGDIFTHCFALLNSRESLADTLTKKIKPFILFPEAWKRQLLVKVSGAHLQQTISHLESSWKTLVSHRPFEFHFLDED